jgi:hypothetical protein
MRYPARPAAKAEKGEDGTFGDRGHGRVPFLK